MLLEVRAASRKTPRDGRFEIAEATARRLSALGETMPFALEDAMGTARVERMACTCEKAGHTGGHEHVFLLSELLRAATPERMYVLELEEGGSVRLTGAHEGLS
ncbi:MAG: hypothetical protein ABI877_14900 [Gemmatimonadaceae bacterium]